MSDCATGSRNGTTQPKRKRTCATGCTHSRVNRLLLNRFPHANREETFFFCFMMHRVQIIRKPFESTVFNFYNVNVASRQKNRKWKSGFIIKAPLQQKGMTWRDCLDYMIGTNMVQAKIRCL